MSAQDPNTDREWMIKLSGQIEGLSKSIDALGERLIFIEERKIASLEERLTAIEKKIEQFKGGWKLIVILWAALSAVVGWIINYFTK